MGPAILLTDGYKVGHIHHMPKEISYQLNNFTPRGTRRDGVDKIMFFGLQYFIKKYLIKKFNKTFFNKPKDKAVAKWYRIIKSYLGKEVTVKHLEDLHDLGFLPIRIKAIKEGERINLKVPPVTMESTRGAKYVWLVGYLETLFSCVVWGPCTSATTAFEFYKIFHEAAMDTVGNADFVPFQGHDFSFRGMFGVQAAVLSGAGHLLSFVGSDTIPTIPFFEKYYYADCEKELVACSVEATEHSVMCLGTGLFIYSKANGDWTRIGDAEFSVFKRLITEVCPTGIISIVSDTFNLWVVLNDFLPRLKAEIMARDGKVVIRPDSGDPVDIMTGNLQDAIEYKGTAEGLKDFATESILQLVREETPHGEAGAYEYTQLFKYGEEYYNITVNNIEWNRYDKQYYYMEQFSALGYSVEKLKVATENLGVVEALWDVFGGTITPKGFKLLDSHVGSIYGDSINTVRARAINARLKAKGFASINWVAGIGSFSYQFVTRDTDMWAMKATYGEANINGETVGIPVFKDPITDDGTKKSARGPIIVTKVVKGDVMANKYSEVNFKLTDQVTREQMDAETYLQLVFEDGVEHRTQSLAEIRQIVKEAVLRND